ncbi:MAG: hypothetical protein NZ700_10365 [Gemmataceae bacterium]|nr:hypothetical protein [Gemmataceae bacterium]MDW8265158.1 hypothetical protein [Gemmataceae bacterium]
MRYPEGPLGFPMPDQQAKAVDALLRTLPKDEAHGYRKTLIDPAVTQLEPGDRADISWITTEDVDRSGDVVRAQGMNDDHFALNPIVTLQHNYDLPPVGRSLWRRLVRDGGRTGIKAKTHYPPRPAGWTGDWLPDHVLALIQAGLLRGKSIGFLPTRSRRPTEAERRRRPEWKTVRFVIEEWVLLEYACVYLPAQQHAVVEAVSKTGLPPAVLKALGLGPLSPSEQVAHAVRQALEAIDWEALGRRSAQRPLDRLQGRV